MNALHAPPVWLITGCSSGLGRALAARVLALGHRGIAPALQPDTLTELVAADPPRCRALARAGEFMNARAAAGIANGPGFSAYGLAARAIDAAGAAEATR
jgi:NAD(P)-dependent dehydrogenase (short-subunit alcohol dehydrogenase family)